MQAKLLRVMQEKEFFPVGGRKTVKMDIRFIATSNKNLKDEVAKGKFREDLFYRLNVVPIHLPPLRERINDMPLLADHFMRKFCKENEKKVKGFSIAAMSLMGGYHWPGNVRELENLVERAVVMAQDEVIGSDELPAELKGGGAVISTPSELEGAVAHAAEPLFIEPDEKGVYRAIVERVENKLLKMALDKAGGVRLKAAGLLGINRNTLHAKLTRMEKEEQ